MDDAKTVWCGNLSDRVTEEILYELFLQAAPLERVKIPTDREGRKSNFGFITFKHQVSVEYALQLLNGTRLFDKNLNVKPRNNNSQNNANRVNNFDNNPPKNDYQSAQNFANTMMDYNTLIRMGQAMQLNAGQVQMPFQFSPQQQDNRHGSRGEYNNYRKGDDRSSSREESGKYRQQDHRQGGSNHYNSSNRQRRNPYNNNRRQNDRSRRTDRY